MPDEKSLQRRTFLKATGGAATALALAGCSTTDDPGTTDGGTDDTNGTDDTKNTDDGDASGSASQRAADAWVTISNNQASTEAAQQKRNDGYVTLEEANWEDMVLLPAYHAVDERFAYDWVDIPKFGGGGDSRQKYNAVSIGSRR
ncbi:hypothetical protein [Haloarchaeobius sp. DYHT-AS-18]|uniref:hypothetical protein n=1 Tax=Haloarchaeobius sp. DYHT-AS-18 TaxID=3446117 RepID=UPI003EBE7D55